MFPISRHITIQSATRKHFRLAISRSIRLAPVRFHSGTPRTQNADVIVVGAGIASVCTSIAAAENGASVILLDRAHGGGASALSGGVVYAGGGTDQQKEAGYEDDSPENMFAYLSKEIGDAVDEETLRQICEGSVARLNWLDSASHSVGCELMAKLDWF